MARTVRYENDRYENVGSGRARRNERKAESYLRDIKGQDPRNVQVDEDEFESFYDK